MLSPGLKFRTSVSVEDNQRTFVARTSVVQVFSNLIKFCRTMVSGRGEGTDNDM